MKMVCRKCGEVCERGSGAQKYCNKCSPWKHQLSGGLSDITCQKCGKTEKPNSARQKYCGECSRHMGHHTTDEKTGRIKSVKTQKPIDPDRQLVCCHCGNRYGKCRKNTCDYNRSRNPCERCEDIVARKRLAEKIKYQRQRKKRISKFCKHLLILEDQAKQSNANKPEYMHNEDHLWTRMRFVSKSELDRMRHHGHSLRWNWGPITQKQADEFNDKWKFLGVICEPDDRSMWERHGRPVGIYRNTGTYGDYEGCITKPGYYRVEKTTEKSKWFETVCHTGIPEAWSNATVKWIEGIIREKRHEGIDRYRRKQYEQEHKEYIERRNHQKQISFNSKIKINSKTKSFFRTLAMAEAVASI
jgi:hypothetical protein